jgi:hypothetical protein
LSGKEEPAKHGHGIDAFGEILCDGRDEEDVTELIGRK